MASKDTNIEIIHAEVVDRVRSKMPAEDILNDVSGLFKLMGDKTRSRILWALAQDELCVDDLAALLNMTKSAISHQLRLLREAKLVKFYRDGKNVIYSLDDNHVKEIFQMTFNHIAEMKKQ